MSELLTFKSQGSYIKEGITIEWESVCEDYPAVWEGETVGTVFTYSFFRTNVENVKNRPVMFCYNGGPGSASNAVMLGFFGPLIADLGEDPVNQSIKKPYQLKDNVNGILDECDIVVIDAVGTGYSSTFDREKLKNFYQLEEDAKVIADVIESWMKKYHRFGSSRFYLAGESFGTLRNSYTLRALMERDIHADGAIMIGNCVNVGEFPRQDAVPEAIQYLPTMAAVNHYHFPEGKPSLEEFVEESRKFCDEEYIAALYKGNRMTEEEKENILEKLYYFTGIPKDIIIREHYAPEGGIQRAWLLADQKKNLSCYDGRFLIDATEELEAAKEPTLLTEAFMAKISPVLYALMCGEFKERMKLDFDRKYVSLNLDLNREYKFERKRNAMKQLELSMKANPEFKLLFVQGYYDLCTVTGIATYMMDHIPYGKERMILKEYPSGHMTYVGKESADQMVKDIKKFINIEG